jgi:Transposase DDE domain
LPKELAFRESRLKKIREARAALEAETRLKSESSSEAQNKDKDGKLTGIPQGKAQRNFTDPESHIMPVSGGKQFEQAYNAQAAVDSANQIIIAADVTDQSSDKGLATPMMQQVEENAGALPHEISADAGYFSSEEVIKLTGMGIEAYIPPDKMRHTAKSPAAPRGRIPQNLTVIERMRRKLKTKKGRKRYG